MAFRLARDARLVRFASADGLRLEGRLTPGDPARAVVLCHPHPLHGGSMLSPVILVAEQAFREAGYTTLAFNFRGVGGSEGTHGEGRDEVADVTGALALLEETLSGVPVHQTIAGYSFGSLVGGHVAAASPRVGFYLGIAPVLKRYDYGFLREAKGRIGLIAGTRDEFGDRTKLSELHASLGARAWLRVLDTDHLFTGALADLARACREAITWAATP